VSQFANKKVKTLLHICAVSALRFDPELKAYFERKTKTEGKPKMAVINAIRYKVVLRIFACLNQDRVYKKGYIRPGSLLCVNDTAMMIEN
jgi:transposase